MPTPPIPHGANAYARAFLLGFAAALGICNDLDWDSARELAAKYGLTADELFNYLEACEDSPSCASTCTTPSPMAPRCPSRGR